MTGKVVSKVNVCVQGVDYCEPNELKTDVFRFFAVFGGKEPVLFY